MLKQVVKKNQKIIQDLNIMHWEDNNGKSMNNKLNLWDQNFKHKSYKNLKFYKNRQELEILQTNDFYSLIKSKNISFVHINFIFIMLYDYNLYKNILVFSWVTKSRFIKTF